MSKMSLESVLMKLMHVLLRAGGINSLKATQYVFISKKMRQMSDGRRKMEDVIIKQR